MKSLRCMLGFHKWEYGTIYYRWFYKKCSICGKNQRVDKDEFFENLYMYEKSSKK